MRVIYFILILGIILSCNNNNNTQNGSASNSSGTANETRETVNPHPVKIYSETVKSETTDDFKVSLFETKETFNYLIKINFKNLEEQDTLNVPNFGIPPTVEIRKGDKRPSCIVGFLDADKQFRESKLVYFEDDALKVHVLKHYGVYSK